MYLYLFIYFIYKLRTQCHTILAQTVQNRNRHWRRNECHINPAKWAAQNRQRNTKYQKNILNRQENR